MIVLAWAVVVGSLPAAVVLFWRSRKLGFVQQQRLLVYCLLVVMLAISAAYLGVRFTIAPLNLSMYALCYFLYCFIVVNLSKISNKLLRILLLAITAAPIAGGYALATVGVLAFMFIAADLVEPPSKIEIISDGVRCRCDTSLWGMAASDSGYRIALYKTWKYFPLLEKRVVSSSINETNPSGNASPSSCSELWASYRKANF